MAQNKNTNHPLMLFNKGVVDTTALARMDKEVIAFSAERMDNWLPKVQGPMRLRPGTQYKGATLNDTGAVFVEFVAAIDEVALLEVTDKKMRVWLGSDAHNLSLLGRPLVTTVVALTDTGWDKANIGGGTRTAGGAGEIPFMTAATTQGVTLSADSEQTWGPAWNAADGDGDTIWSGTASDTGWIQVDFGTARQIETVTIKSTWENNAAPEDFWIQGNHADTGDLNSWTTEQSWSGQSWSDQETKTFTDTGYSDTGGNSWRYWRVYVQETPTENANIEIQELQMLTGQGDTGQVIFSGAGLSLNAGAISSLARVKKRVAATDTGNINKEHSLNINVSCGPVTIRVGSTDGSDDLISETALGTGYHNLAFFPSAIPFYITLQSASIVNISISSLVIGDSGTVEIIAPWTSDTGSSGIHGSSDLPNLRYDQSQDVIYVASAGVQQHKIERRGDGVSIGRSWSIVRYYPKLGPFRTNFDLGTKLGVDGYVGTVTLTSNVPFFKSGHVGALFRITHDGQSTTEKLGFTDGATTAVSVSGISESDTGYIDNFTTQDERRISFAITGTYVGTIDIERSFESKDYGFSLINGDNIKPTGTGAASDTGTFTTVIHDPDSNATIYYRARMSAWTSGTATIAVSAPRSVRAGIFRVLSIKNNMSATAEVLRPTSSTAVTDDWSEGSWSEQRGFPSAIALHEGRLAHAGVGQLWLSVSDDYENFDDELVGDSRPIVRTFGSGPVDKIYYLASMQSLLAGSADAELSVRSSLTDEVLTPSNASARRISSQGSANVRPIKRDQDVLFVQRSKQRLYRVSQKENTSSSQTEEMTIFVPGILKTGVTSVAIQRQPETRMHFALADGTVALFSFDPLTGSAAWSKWVGDTGTSPFVEQVSVLPAVEEDAVYYLIKRTINGATKRYLEKWAKESESFGDTGLSYLADCSKSYTDTGRATAITGMQHLAGESVVVWGSDTGQAVNGRDFSPDVATVQTEYAVGTGGATDTGELTLSSPVHHAVAGLPYKGVWVSSKLTHNPEYGTSLGQMQRPSQIAFVLYKTHNNGLFFGNDTGLVDPLPRKSHQGAVVDADKIFLTRDMAAMPFPGEWDEDSRIVLVAKSPRPAMVMAAIPSNRLNEKA